MRLQPLRNAYNLRDLRAELGGTMKYLKQADLQETVVSPDYYSIQVPDEAPMRGAISQKLPLMFGQVLVDAQVKPGVWEDRFFVVIRPNAHETIIREARFSPVSAQVEEVVLRSGQQDPSYVSFDQGPVQFVGSHWGKEPLAELDSTQAERLQAQARVEQMLIQAKSIVGGGRWGFCNPPIRNGPSDYELYRSPL